MGTADICLDMLGRLGILSRCIQRSLWVGSSQNQTQNLTAVEADRGYHRSTFSNLSWQYFSFPYLFSFSLSLAQPLNFLLKLILNFCNKTALILTHHSFIVKAFFYIFVCGHRPKTKELLELLFLLFLSFAIWFISSLKEI